MADRTVRRRQSQQKTPLFRSAGASDEAGDDGDQFVWVGWLGQVHLETGQHGTTAVFGSSEGGEGDCGQIFGGIAARSNFANQIEAVFFGHADVTDEHIGMILVEDVESCIDGIGGADVGLAVGEHLLHEPAGIWFVVDNEDFQPVEQGGTAVVFGIWRGLRLDFVWRSFADDRERQSDDECSALPFAGAFRTNAAAV